MSPKPTVKQSFAATIRENWSDKQDLSGSTNPWLSCNLVNQMLRVSWRGSREDADTKLLHDQAVLAAMAGIAPRDPIEGLLAAQMVAVHEASMECFRRAALPEQTFAGREMGLKYGAKLARTYATLVETLDRHRGKGQPQVVRVERVTVEAGGQAIVGTVNPGGVGGSDKSEDRPHAQGIGSHRYAARKRQLRPEHSDAQPTLAHAPEPSMRRSDPSGKPVSVAGSEGA